MDHEGHKVNLALLAIHAELYGERQGVQAHSNPARVRKGTRKCIFNPQYSSNFVRNLGTSPELRVKDIGTAHNPGLVSISSLLFEVIGDEECDV